MNGEDFEFKPLNPFKVPLIVSDQRKPEGECGRADDEVVGTDVNAPLTQIRPEFRVYPGNGDIKGIDWKKFYNLLHICTSF